MATRTLHAVTSDDQPSAPERRKAANVAEAVESGDQREQFVAMRARIARAIDEPNIRGADLAALSRRLLEVVKEIEAIDAREAQDAAESASTADEDWIAI